MIRINALRQTCSKSPALWEARTIDDHPVYIRYRHGELRVHVGPVGGSIDDAIDAKPVFDEDVGKVHGCMLDWSEVVEAAGIKVVDA